jgi:Lysyl oxidase
MSGLHDRDARPELPGPGGAEVPWERPRTPEAGEALIASAPMLSRSALLAGTLACLVLAAAALAVGVPAGVAGPSPAQPGEQLPDLDPAAPNELMLQTAGTRKRPAYRLGFQSATGNVGNGPLVIDGHRPGTATPAMVADQLIERGAVAPEVVPGVGALKYVHSPDHVHWHLLGFMRYELRRAGSGRLLVRDRKTGFCLGDRYQVTAPGLQARTGAKVYTSRCGLHQPDLLDVREGISVGYGDNYTAFLEGQSLPLTGLRSGRYLLVHRVNVTRRLHELSYDNNASSVLLDLRWRRHIPFLTVLASCPDSDRCAAGKMG